jgi:BMFP domain-containing protein YqiC
VAGVRLASPPKEAQARRQERDLARERSYREFVATKFLHWPGFAPISVSDEMNFPGVSKMSPQRPGFFDDVSRLFNDAAGAARSLGKEAEAAIKTQVERLLAGMDLVNREEFEAARDIAVAARNANDALERRISELEAKIAALEAKG